MTTVRRPVRARVAAAVGAPRAHVNGAPLSKGPHVIATGSAVRGSAAPG